MIASRASRCPRRVSQRDHTLSGPGTGMRRDLGATVGAMDRVTAFSTGGSSQSSDPRAGHKCT